MGEHTSNEREWPAAGNNPAQKEHVRTSAAECAHAGDFGKALTCRMVNKTGRHLRVTEVVEIVVHLRAAVVLEALKVVVAVAIVLPV